LAHAQGSCWAAFGLLGLALLGLLVPGSGSAAALPGPLPLRVQGGEIVGPAGQEVFLRGVNVNALVAYSPNHPEAVPVGPTSFQEMAALGFDVVRLPVSLSALEPQPGRISVAYVQEIQRVVGWAAASGLWVVLDLHQDHYAAGLYPGEADGMPAWMVDTLGLPRQPLLLGITDPAVQGAFTAFWDDARRDGVSLWQAYDEGLAALARTFAGDPALAGYDVMNEPNPGLHLTPDFPVRYLLPFYRGAVATIRRYDGTHPIFLEPDVLSMATGHVAWPRQPWLRDGVVLETHEYVPVDALTSPHGRAVETASSQALLTLLYRESDAARRADGLPWWIGEFGAPPDRLGDAEVAQEIALQDAYRVGSAFWLWQIRPGTYDWQLVERNGALAPDSARLASLTSPHPVVVGGRILRLAWQPGQRTFSLQYEASADLGPTIVETSSVSYPHGILWHASAPAELATQNLPVPGTTLTLYRITVAPANGLVEVTLSPPSSSGA
jgi:endoglycosylceramidase